MPPIDWWISMAASAKILENYLGPEYRDTGKAEIHPLKRASKCRKTHFRGIYRNARKPLQGHLQKYWKIIQGLNTEIQEK